MVLWNLPISTAYLEQRTENRVQSVMREKLKAQGKTRELGCRSNKMVFILNQKFRKDF